MRRTALVVEDDRGLLPSLVTLLERAGFAVTAAQTRAKGLEHVGREHFDVVLLDLKLPDGSGLDVLAAAREAGAATAVIVLTAFPDLKVAVRAMQEGAFDFVAKPFELEELRLTIERAVEVRELRQKVMRLERLSAEQETGAIVGGSGLAAELRAQIARASAADVPVLVTGETGTGKELVASALHQASSRAPWPLVATNCSCFSEALLESELFGHEKGAFTDAREARVGLFEMARGGTLFLDEVAELKLPLQARLLRVLEGHPFRRVGGTREVRVDVRIVAATNKELRTEVAAGRFREDLFYRLNVLQIVVPPLRDRAADVVPLALHFLRLSTARLGRAVAGFTSEAEAVLTAYPWPGNVRELKNVVERAVIVCDGPVIEEGHLPGELRIEAFVQRSALRRPDELSTLEEVERKYVEHVLAALSNNLSEASRVLGISRNTLKAKLRRD